MLASELHPDSAWSKVVALQEAASAPAKAPKPKKPVQAQLASNIADAAPMETDSGGDLLEQFALLLNNYLS